MPAQSVWMIRLSLSYFFLATLTGAVMLVHKSVYLHHAVWVLLPVHYEMAIWGWLVQFVMGTAYWIFPRYLEDKGRGPQGLAWAMVVAVNAGLWLLILSNITAAENLAAAGRGLLLAGILMFARLIWNRVVSYRHKK